jgi:hypothetical protein
MRESAPNELLDALADERITLVAHNVGFERRLLSGPPGRALGLPASLSALERWSDTHKPEQHVSACHWPWKTSAVRFAFPSKKTAKATD